jgi:hypothetical protein
LIGFTQCWMRGLEYRLGCAAHGSSEFRPSIDMEI